MKKPVPPQGVEALRKRKAKSEARMKILTAAKARLRLEVAERWERMKGGKK